MFVCSSCWGTSKEPNECASFVIRTFLCAFECRGIVSETVARSSSSLSTTKSAGSTSVSLYRVLSDGYKRWVQADTVSKPVCRVHRVHSVFACEHDVDRISGRHLHWRLSVSQISFPQTCADYRNFEFIARMRKRRQTSENLVGIPIRYMANVEQARFVPVV